MTDALTQVVVMLNAGANFLGQPLAFISALPGWLSAAIVAVASGIGLLLVFKQTSNQRAIKRTRHQIRANLLSVKLFFDSPMIGFQGQLSALVGALTLLVLAVVPILVMLVPVTLLLGQLALWYQARPLKNGEDTIITLKLHGDRTAPWPSVKFDPQDAVEVTHGPVRVISQREICWSLRAKQNGLHTLTFHVDGYTVEKELVVGDGFMRVSQRRPDWDWSDVMLHPAEPPFPSGSLVRSIDIQYPARSDTWVYSWFIVSFISGFLFRGVFKVNL
jgi:hypothetical protein